MAHVRRDSHVCPRYPPLRHDRRVLKRGLADQKLVGQDAQAPQVNFFIVVILGGPGLDHLGRQIIQGATHGLSPVVGSMHAPPEIGNLELAVDADEDVFGLDVPVDNVLAVQITQGRRHLGNVLGSLPFREAVLPAQVLVQFPLAGELENQKHALIVVEVAKHLQDIGMTEVALNLNLAADLALDASALQLVLVQHLERADEAARALPSKVHAPEFALAQRTADFEHSQVELLRD